MRLLKLFFYAAVGYVLYELYQGVRDGSSMRQSSANSGRSRDFDRAANEDQGRTANFTGSGRGTTVATTDSDGQSVKHVVGRGVVTN